MKLIFGQWSWDWGESITKKNESGWYGVVFNDFFNKNYSKILYNDSIFFPDTSFYHPDSFHNSWAIGEYNSGGRLVSVFDLYSPEDNLILNPNLITDSDNNIYITVEFMETVCISDTVLSPPNIPEPFVPIIIVAKMNSKLDLIWAKYIMSTTQSFCNGLAISKNDEIYITTEHYANGESQFVNIIDQDTINFSSTLNTVIKIDTDGNLLWCKEIQSQNPGANGSEILIGGNENIYFHGRTFFNLIIDNDTIYHPDNMVSDFRPFIFSFDSSGNLISGEIKDWSMGILEMEVNSTGDYFLSGIVIETLVFGQDTIISTGDTTVTLIGKLNAEQVPVWSEVVKTINQQTMYFRISKVNDLLAFATSCSKNFMFTDTLFSIGNKSKVFAGIFDSLGELSNFTFQESTHGIFANFISTDNCQNLIISGSFKGTALIGSDSISSYSNDYFDPYVAKLSVQELNTIDIGPDTVLCAAYTVYGPEGYLFYSLNDSLIDHYWFNTNQSGAYVFGCSNDDGCWLYDTINIEIHPGFEIELGSDTTIRENDTIVFSVPDQYESYLWSDGSTSDHITIIGNEYGIGTFPIWIEITDGPCIETDSIFLTIKSEFGIYERINNHINIFPNPFKDEITIEIEPDYQVLEICDLNGIIRYSSNLEKQFNESKKIITGKLHKGIYLLKIKTRKQNLIKKIIKI
jgi:hypothetical protein